MPQPLDEEMRTVDMGGFVFTPLGLRFDLTSEDRTALLAEAYRPEVLS